MFRLYSNCDPQYRAIFPFESGGFGFKGINNMLDDIHSRQMRRYGGSRSSLGRSHIYRKGQSLVLSIDMPGVHGDDLQVRVLPDSNLEISAKRFWNEKERDENIIDKDQESPDEAESRNFEEYHQVFALSEDINRDEIDAQCNDGVLRVVLPLVGEKQQEQAREIKIRDSKNLK